VYPANKNSAAITHSYTKHKPQNNTHTRTNHTRHALTFHTRPSTRKYTHFHTRTQKIPKHSSQHATYQLEISITSVDNQQATAPMQRRPPPCAREQRVPLDHDRWASHSTDCATLHRTKDSRAQPRARTRLHMMDPWIHGSMDRGKVVVWCPHNRTLRFVA
jgi:hypothetical protein